MIVYVSVSLLYIRSVLLLYVFFATCFIHPTICLHGMSWICLILLKSYFALIAWPCYGLWSESPADGHLGLRHVFTLPNNTAVHVVTQASVCTCANIFSRGDTSKGTCLSKRLCRFALLLAIFKSPYVHTPH